MWYDTKISFQSAKFGGLYFVCLVPCLYGSNSNASVSNRIVQRPVTQLCQHGHADISTSCTLHHHNNFNSHVCRKLIGVSPERATIRVEFV
ncbi:hypothetical protein V1525DRAFT_411826 [Lipomyces kononenkoae]|uniref:Uncharacterized protein n=1 Tax=Lipomyces kononenkoae TaxID=34357 RepID=A0ACC3ST45_LIPKO